MTVRPLTVAGAFVVRDWLNESSYRAMFVFEALNLIGSLVVFYALGELVRMENIGLKGQLVDPNYIAAPILARPARKSFQDFNSIHSFFLGIAKRKFRNSFAGEKPGGRLIIAVEFLILTNVR